MFERGYAAQKPDCISPLRDIRPEDDRASPRSRRCAYRVQAEAASDVGQPGRPLLVQTGSASDIRRRARNHAEADSQDTSFPRDSIGEAERRRRALAMQTGRPELHEIRIPIKRSRKELDRLEIEDWAREAVVHAAEWTTMQTPDYLHASIQLQVSLCGKTLASVLDQEDKPALFVPADIATESGNQTGVVLNTDSGAVFAWTEGRFRLSYLVITIPAEAVRELSTPAPSDDYNASLSVVTDNGPLTANFAAIRSDAGPKGLLDGVIASLRGEGKSEA
jgi:hypothetical protein